MPGDPDITDKQTSAEDTVARGLGRAAFRERKNLDANPFSWLRDGNKRTEWSDGWFSERAALVRKSA